jgi:hypothetical protein
MLTLAYSDRAMARRKRRRGRAHALLQAELGKGEKKTGKAWNKGKLQSMSRL